MADGRDFQPGNIISDAVFYNCGTMSEAQIQAFLNGKVPTCQAGYTCLKDWYDTTPARPPPSDVRRVPGRHERPASRIISKVGQACGINPQVLLVTLQKEQGLVITRGRATWRYRRHGTAAPTPPRATPGTTASSTRCTAPPGSSSATRTRPDQPGLHVVRAGQDLERALPPERRVRPSPVYIQNQATASLYDYTPYQPNAPRSPPATARRQRVLRYGNRNFWHYFTDWFGSTQDRRRSAAL